MTRCAAKKHGRGVGPNAVAMLLGDIDLGTRFREREFLTVDQLMSAEELTCDGFGKLLLTLQARNPIVMSIFFGRQSPLL